MARKILMVPDVIIKDGMQNSRTGELSDMFISMVTYLDLKTGGHQKFGGNLDGIEQASRIRTAYKEAKRSFQLEEQDWEELKKSLSSLVNPEININCEPFARAIVNAVQIEEPLSKQIEKKVKKKKRK